MRWQIVAVAVISIAVFGAQTAHASVIQMTPNNIGLVGYWSFNEGTSTIAHDYSGNGNNGTLSGSTLPSWTNGKFGTALQFDGSSSYIPVSGLTLGNTFSVSLWVNPSNYDPSGSSGYPNWVGGAGSPDLILGGKNGGNLFYSTGDYFSTPFTALSLNTWNYVTYVVGGGNISLYINGAFKETQSYSPASITNLMLAYSPSNSCCFFGGKLDDVRVYDRALSATEVAGLYQSGLAKINVSQSPGTLSQGLVGWWTMDGADTVWSSPTAGNEIDHSGNGNTGTLTSMTQSGSPTVGKIGQALSFNGSSSYVDMTGSSGVADNLSNFTVSAWFKISTSVSGDAEIVSKIGAGGIASGQGWALDIHGNDLIGIIQQEPANYYAVKISTNTVTDGSWHQGVMVVTGGNTMTLYLDGQVQPTSATGGTVTTFTNTSDIRIANDYNSKFFPGSIDDARIYDRALSASEVEQLYGLGAGTHVNTSSANLQRGSSLSQGLVGLWTFDGKDTNWATGQETDESGNGNTGQLIGLSTTTSPTIGVLGQAMKFNYQGTYPGGTNQEMTFSSIPMGTTNTVAMWVHLNGPPQGTPDNYQTLYVEDASSGLWLDNDYIDLYDGSDHLSTTALSPGQWYHVAVVDNAGSVTFYLDGVPDGTGSTVLTYDANAVGSDHLDEALNGSIDDVRVYDRALSPSEVEYLYLMGQ